jgi:tetratricopeptide (TPR) repeat protein
VAKRRDGFLIPEFATEGESAKIGWSMAALATLVATASLSFAIYYAISFQRGMKLWNEGFAAANSGDFDTAISKYGAALHTRLGRYNAGVIYSNRGVAYNAKGLLDHAVSDFTEALRLHPSLVEAYVGRSFAYLNRGEVEKALGDANEAIRLDQNSRGAYHNRAMAFLWKREFDKAIADFSEAIRCDPNNADLYAKRGSAFAAKGDYDAAIASFDSAIRIAPKFADAYLGRATAWEQKNNWYDAVKDYDTAYQLVPDAEKAKAASILNAARARGDAFPKTQKQLESYVGEKRAFELLNQGIKAASEQKYDEAIRIYTDALEAGPGVSNRAVILCNRGTTFGRTKQREKSGRDYNEAIRLNPTFVEAYYNRGVNESELKQFDKAVADFSEAIRLNPRYVRAYLNRGAIYLRRRQLKQANKDYKAAVAEIEQLEPEMRHHVLNSIAWLRSTSPRKSLRDGKEAVQEATQACEMTGWKNWAYLDTLAAAYAETGDFENAVKFQTQAIEMSAASDGRRAGMLKRLELYHKQKPYRES